MSDIDFWIEPGEKMGLKGTELAKFIQDERDREERTRSEQLSHERERAYSVIEKECLAVVWGTQKFEQYLYGRQFVIQTDHAPLVYLERSKVANGRLMRWALALQSYTFRIEAIKGSDNVGADYLSRIPE